MVGSKGEGRWVVVVVGFWGLELMVVWGGFCCCDCG
jgi:hypothetical protein